MGFYILSAEGATKKEAFLLHHQAVVQQMQHSSGQNYSNSEKVLRKDSSNPWGPIACQMYLPFDILQREDGVIHLGTSFTETTMTMKIFTKVRTMGLEDKKVCLLMYNKTLLLTRYWSDDALYAPAHTQEIQQYYGVHLGW